MMDESLHALARRAAKVSADVLRWWGGELRDLVPRRWRRRLTASSSTLRFEMIGGRLLLRTRCRGRRRTLGAWELGAVGPGIVGEVERAVRAAGLRRAPTVVRPAPGQVLRRPVSLPERAEESLPEVLPFEIDRHTPFRADRVLFTHRITRRQTDQERIDLELIVVPQRVLTPVLAVVAACGLPPPVVEVPDPPRRDRPRIPLAPAGESAVGRLRPWLAAGAAALTIVLLFTAMSIRLDRLGEEAERRDHALRLAMAEASKADQLREEIAGLSKEAAIFLDRKRKSPPLLAVLNELTRLLPDHTWIQEFHLRGAEIQISGQSVSAAGLVELIEYSPMFRKANFTSPITRAQNEERERFHLGFEVELLDAPRLAEHSPTNR
ncbi:MAG TPA: PilN domain-containing protein [Azospirillum sp.]|nr:PilN domain-containing protein [Azospirillum sp.]